MKKMKKTIGLILAVIMLFTAVPLQSFALFDNLNPTVVKVEFADDLPVSNQYVQNGEYYMGDALGKTMVTGIGDRCLYDYRVYLSNGKVLEVKDGYYEEERPLINRIRYCGVVLTVDPKECAAAIAQGKETVATEVTVMLGLKNEDIVPFTAELEKPVVPGIVKDVKLIDTMPEIEYDGYIEAYFEGKSFEVEYFSGEKKIYTLQKKTVEYGEEYFLGDDFLYMWWDTKNYSDEATGETGYVKRINMKYLDASIAVSENKVPCPYEKIEILDYTVGDSGITGITYKLTYKDGTTFGNTKTFDTLSEEDGYVVIDTVGGDDITAFLNCFEEEYYLEIYIGDYEWYMGDVAVGETRDICDCICHENGIKYIISVLLRKIWEIFSVKEWCECGSWHW